jgi:membrane protease YdiL (CAAX protease family)
MSSAPPPLPPGWAPPAPPVWPPPGDASPPPPPGDRDDERSRLPHFAWWAPFVCGLAVYFGTGVLAAFIAALGGWTKLPTGAVLAATVVQDAALIAGVFIFAQATGAAVRPASLGLRRVRVGRGLMWAIVAFVAFYVLTLLWSAVLGVKESDDLAEQLGAKDSAANLVIVAVLVAILAPIAEELFFRGFLFTALWRPLGWIPAALITGVVFGVVHAGGTPAVFLVPLAILGFLLCWLYRRTGSLIPGMGLHAFNNALALGVTLSWAWWQVLVAVAVGPAVVIAIAAAWAGPRPAPAVP